MENRKKGRRTVSCVEQEAHRYRRMGQLFWQISKGKGNDKTLIPSTQAVCRSLQIAIETARISPLLLLLCVHRTRRESTIHRRRRRRTCRRCPCRRSRHRPCSHQ